MKALIAISAVLILFGTGFLTGQSFAYASMMPNDCTAQSKDLGTLWGEFMTAGGHSLERYGDVWCLK